MNRGVLAVLALVFIAAGLVLGLRTIHAGDVDCGSVLAPSNAGAEQADFSEEIGGTLEGAAPDEDTTNNQAACASARSDAKPLAYGGLGLGAIALLATFVVPSGTSSAQRRTS